MHSVALVDLRRLVVPTQPQAGALVFGLDPLINFLGDRAAPTRFGYVLPLVATRDGANNLLRGRSSAEHLQEFAALSRFVREHYVLERKMDQYLLFRRRPPGLRDSPPVVDTRATS